MITVDAVYSGVNNGGTSSTTLSWSHTVNSGDNRLLIVTFHAFGGPSSVSSVTYGGQSLTKVSDAYESSRSVLSSMWYLINPNVGTNTITVNYSSTTNTCAGSSMSLFGVKQISPLYSYQSTTATNTHTISVNLNANTNDIIIEAISSNEDASASLDVSSSQTIYYSTRILNTNPAYWVKDARKIASSSGSYTETWSVGTTYFINSATLVGAVFSAAPPSSSSFFLFFNN